MVTVDPWSVSYTITGYREEKTVVLNVHRTLDIPNKFGGRGVSLHHKVSGTSFQGEWAEEEAKKLAMAEGVIRDYYEDQE